MSHGAESALAALRFCIANLIKLFTRDR